MSDKEIRAAILKFMPEANLEGMETKELQETLADLQAAAENEKKTAGLDKKEKEAKAKAKAEAEAQAKADDKAKADAAAKAEAEAKAKQKSKDDKRDAAVQAREKRKATEKALAAKAEKALPPFRVAPGKSITTKRGIKSDGEEVKAAWFANGDDTLTDLVSRGFVLEK